MNFTERIEIAAAAAAEKQITVWNAASEAASRKMLLRTQKYLSGNNLAEDLGKAICKAVKNWDFNVEIPFKLPYHLWRLEPQLAPCKEFWKEQGVKFRTLKAKNGNPHIIYFEIPFSASESIVKSVESAHEFSTSDSVFDENTEEKK